MPKPILRVFAHSETTPTDSSDAVVSSAKNSQNSSPKKPALLSMRTEHELDRVAGTLAPRTVTVRLATIVPLLLDAVEKNRTWLSDFADDTVRLDADLYEVLLAYQGLREGAAA